MCQVVNLDRVHVVNDDPVMNFIAFDAKIPAEVSRYDVLPDILPLPGGVESLVQPPLKAERLYSYRHGYSKVLIAFPQAFDLAELRVGSSLQGSRPGLQ